MASDYDNYRIFFYVAAEKNMSAAVSRLGISTSTASRAIKALEQHLGKALFIRESHGISLTETGKELYARISPSLQELLTCQRQLKSGDPRSQTTINLSIDQYDFQNVVIPHCLGALYRHYPDVRVRNTPADNNLEYKLLSGELDFACSTNAKLVTQCCEVTPLMEIFTVPIVGELFIDRFRNGATLDELSRLPLIFTPEYFAVYNIYSQLYTRFGLNMSVAITVSSLSEQIAAVKAGLGYSFVPFIYLAPQEDGLYPLQTDTDILPSKVLFLLHNKDRCISPPGKMLRDLIIKAFADAEMHQDNFFNNGKRGG